MILKANLGGKEQGLRHKPFQQTIVFSAESNGLSASVRLAHQDTPCYA